MLASLAGGALAALVTGGGNSLGSMLGLVGVLAIAARNAILLIEPSRRLEEPTGMVLGVDLVVRTAARQLAAITVSAVAIAAALLAIVVLGKTAGLEVAHSIAVVMIGGVGVSALVSLFVIPPLYLLVAERSERAALK